MTKIDSNEIMIYGTLKYVPFTVTAEYGSPLKHFTWNFLSKNKEKNAENITKDSLSTWTSTATTLQTDKLKPLIKETDILEHASASIEEVRREISESTATKVPKLVTKSENKFGPKTPLITKFTSKFSDSSYVDYTSTSTLCKLNVIIIIMASLFIF